MILGPLGYGPSTLPLRHSATGVDSSLHSHCHLFLNASLVPLKEFVLLSFDLSR